LRVVDASALVELLLDTPKGHAVAEALRGEQLTAPELVYTEVLSAVGRRVRADMLDSATATAAIRLLAAAPIQLVSARVLIPRVWELRERVRVTDAFYVACAERLGCPLVTCDGRLVRAPLPGVAMLHID